MSEAEEKLYKIISCIPIEERGFSCEECPAADLCEIYSNRLECREIATIRLNNIQKHHKEQEEV